MKQTLAELEGEAASPPCGTSLGLRGRVGLSSCGKRVLLLTAAPRLLGAGHRLQAHGIQELERVAPQ